MTNCKYIDNYITMVRSADPFPYCKWQHKLCDFVEKVFETENVYVDEEQLEKYLALQKYFDYRLLPWELFVFTLHICTYTEQGYLRFPYCFVNVGRGAGKNGLLSFIDFLLTHSGSRGKELRHFTFMLCRRIRLKHRGLIFTAFSMIIRPQ
jgi:hypothetical protein